MTYGLSIDSKVVTIIRAQSLHAANDLLIVHLYIKEMLQAS